MELPEKYFFCILYEDLWLKKADLVWEKKEKNFVFYELNTSVLEEIMLWISDLKGENSDDKKES